MKKYFKYGLDQYTSKVRQLLKSVEARDEIIY